MSRASVVGFLSIAIALAASPAVRVEAGPHEDFAASFYTEILKRSPDSTGLAAWGNVLRTHCDARGFDSIATGFFDSVEFRTAKPQTLSTLVTTLYRTFLGRNPDPGMAGWVGLLRDARLTVATQGFIPSEEFRHLLPDPMDRTAVTNLVTRLYGQILQRSPDPAGLTGWVDFIARTGDFDSAAQGFLLSPEFENRQLTFRDYVTVLYRTFLGREPDSPGLDGWEGVLRSTLLDVINHGFVPSPEFQAKERALCGTAGEVHDAGEVHEAGEHPVEDEHNDVDEHQVEDEHGGRHH